MRDVSAHTHFTGISQTRVRVQQRSLGKERILFTLGPEAGRRRRREIIPLTKEQAETQLVEQSTHQDNLQRREYAKAALTGLLANPGFEEDCRTAVAASEDAAAQWAANCADALLAEQKRRVR